MITQGLGLFVPFFRWNSVLFEGWVSMSVVWEKNLQDPGPQCNSIPIRAAQTGLWLWGQKPSQYSQDFIPQEGWWSFHFQLCG